MTFFYALIIEYALQGHTLQARMYLESSKACYDALAQSGRCYGQVTQVQENKTWVLHLK